MVVTGAAGVAAPAAGATSGAGRGVPALPAGVAVGAGAAAVAGAGVSAGSGVPVLMSGVVVTDGPSQTLRAELPVADATRFFVRLRVTSP